MNRTKAATLAGGAAIAALSIAACSSTGHYDGPAPGHTHRPVAAATTAPAPPDKCAQAVAWRSTGLANLNTIEADLTNNTTDAGNYDLNALRADGSQLAQDAATAQGNPPPISARTYSRAMSDFQAAGKALESGNVTGATLMLDRASTLVVKVTTALKAQCG